MANQENTITTNKERARTETLAHGHVRATCTCGWAQTYVSTKHIEAQRIAYIAARAHARKAHGVREPELREPGE